MSFNCDNVLAGIFTLPVLFLMSDATPYLVVAPG